MRQRRRSSEFEPPSRTRLATNGAQPSMRYAVVSPRLRCRDTSPVSDRGLVAAARLAAAVANTTAAKPAARLLGSSAAAVAAAALANAPQSPSDTLGERLRRSSAGTAGYPTGAGIAWRPETQSPTSSSRQLEINRLEAPFVQTRPAQATPAQALPAMERVVGHRRKTPFVAPSLIEQVVTPASTAVELQVNLDIPAPTPSQEPVPNNLPSTDQVEPRRRRATIASCVTVDEEVSPLLLPIAAVRVPPGEVVPVAARHDADQAGLDSSPTARPQLRRSQSVLRCERQPTLTRAKSVDPRARERLVSAFGDEDQSPDVESLARQAFQRVRSAAILPVGDVSPTAALRTARQSCGVSEAAPVVGMLSAVSAELPPFKSLASSLFNGRYSIGRFLGKGASASVWEATRSDSQQSIAVKVFDQGQRDKRQAHREMRVLARVQHPRVLEAFEVIELPKHAQLICELVDGESLRAFTHRQSSRKLSDAVARRLFQQVVEGVSFCHDCLVVHRDLKLENLLLDKRHEHIKIIDFGFAMQVASKETKLRAFCGTPSYMAPEIIRGDGYSGFAVDVWALGVVLFALLSGTLPFTGRAEMQLYAKIRRGQFSLPDCIGESPKQLIRAAMRMDFASRPSSSSMLRSSWITGRTESSSEGDSTGSNSRSQQTSRRSSQGGGECQEAKSSAITKASPMTGCRSPKACKTSPRLIAGQNAGFTNSKLITLLGTAFGGS